MGAPRGMRRAAAHGMEPGENVANAGVLRPPWLLCGALFAGGVLELLWPTPLLDAVPVAVGIVAIAAAVVLFALAAREFRAAGTAIPGNQPTTTIVRTGPYRWTRNPIYLSFFLLQLGVALATQSAWVLVTLVPLVALIAGLVVPREERYLERGFGPSYADYVASVRRWL